MAKKKRKQAKRLYRSRSDRLFLGVCGGIAEHFNSDPVLVRIITVLVMLATGVIPFLIIYLIAAAIIPEK